MSDSLEQPLPDDVRNVPSTASDRTGAPLLPIHDAARALVEKLWCTGDMQRGKALVLAFAQQAVAQERERCLDMLDRAMALTSVPEHCQDQAWDDERNALQLLLNRTMPTPHTGGEG